MWTVNTFPPCQVYSPIYYQIRRSANDNTPHPLDRWTNNPFMGQQVGNCKFHIDPLLGWSICHAPWPKVNPTVHRTWYPFNTPFIPSQTTLPFLRYSNFNILPWKSKVKVIGEVKVQSHNMGATSYRFKSRFYHVNPPSHSYDIDFFFQNFTLKIYVQGLSSIT